MQVKIKT